MVTLPLHMRFDVPITYFLQKATGGFVGAALASRYVADAVMRHIVPYRHE